MPSLSISRPWLRGFSFALLVVLAIAFALFWQRLQVPLASVATVEQQVNTSDSERPIQPLPLKLALNDNKVALGKQLFYDTRLSKNNQVACISCHGIDTGGVDQAAHSKGWKGALTKVNTSTVFNSGFNFRLNWDGRFETLAEQADASVTSPVLMGSDWEQVVDKLKQVPEYVKTFARTYSDGITRQNVTDAIAVYEQSLFTPNSRFDKFLRGDANALTTPEKKGYELFKNYGCISCHQGMNIGGNIYQQFGIMADYFAWRSDITPADYGRFNVTGRESDRFVFRVPSLRNIALTPPYFHDASADTLPQAVAIMAKYQLGRPLSPEDIDLIVQFLNTLSGEYQGNPL